MNIESLLLTAKKVFRYSPARRRRASRFISEKVSLKYLAFTLLLASASVHSEPISIRDAARASAGIAVWEALNDQDIQAAHFSYEFSPMEDFYSARPTLMMIYAEGGNIHISAGLTKEMAINEDFSWGFGSQIGFMDDDRVLGHKIEFYSRIYGSYHISNITSASIEFGHISNSRLGRYNPGSESLVFSISRTIHR